MQTILPQICDMAASDMLIREATGSDVAAIANLHADSWRSSYRGILADDYLDTEVHRERAAVWQQRFANPAANSILVLVAEINAQLVGFSCVFPEENSVFGSYLDNLHVVPQLTGRGIGRRLLSESARRLLSRGSRSGLYLWVVEQNLKARNFYEKAGAAEVGQEMISMPDGNRIAAIRCYWPDLASLVL
jgi:ribosomal protein S18 acetylase RimI-like enzyme